MLPPAPVSYTHLSQVEIRVIGTQTKHLHLCLRSSSYTNSIETILRASLQQLLADFQVYYTNLRGFHWNIKGHDLDVYKRQH